MYKKIVGFVITVFCISLLGFICLKDGLFSDNKKDYRIETSDIDLFWIAFDNLKKIQTTTDSSAVIQQLYLDKMSKSGKEFVKIREYTADEYIQTIRKYAKYFSALRVKTKAITLYKLAIDSTLKKLQAAIPDYKIPDICFAIGCFRGGGTTKKQLILIGSEIALADSTMDCSEFKGWLHTLLSRSDGNVTALIAHESIHCQQKHGQNRTLLSLSLQEGTADFLPELILHTTINQITKSYGIDHECDLWNEFKPRMHDDHIDRWLFNSSNPNGRPADLGYFVGTRICEAYYKKQTDKKKAIADLLDRSNYVRVMQQSGYSGNCP